MSNDGPVYFSLIEEPDGNNQGLIAICCFDVELSPSPSLALLSLSHSASVFVVFVEVCWSSTTAAASHTCWSGL